MTLVSWWLNNLMIADPPPSRVDEIMSPKQQRQEIAPKRPSIAVKDVPGDIPKFQRCYSARLDDRAVCTVTAKSYTHGPRNFMGELKQPNGNALWFDPDRIADRILDPTLVPLVTEFVREVKILDREFMASNPSSYVDDRGNTWVRRGSVLLPIKQGD